MEEAVVPMVIRFYTTSLVHPSAVAFFVIPFEVPTPAGPAIILGKGQIHRDESGRFSVVWSRHKQGWMAFAPEDEGSTARMGPVILAEWEKFRRGS